MHWMGSALDNLRSMPERVQKRIGRALLVAQRGGRPREATPLLGFGGASVLEIKDMSELHQVDWHKIKMDLIPGPLPNRRLKAKPPCGSSSSVMWIMVNRP